MRKLLSPLFRLAFSIFLLVLVGHSVTVLAQPGVGIEDFTRQPYRLANETTELNITSSNAYTIYLPIIYVPPPPNPKKGVDAVASPACADMEALDASWYLNWKLKPDTTCSSNNNKNFVPRISAADSMPLLSLAIANAQASGWLIGFSEPNLPWQGNLTPTEGAILWKQIEDAADPAGIKLVSPSPNQYDPGQADPYGHQWTWAMVDKYKTMYGHNPRFDAIGWNIYKSNPDATKAFLIARHNEALAKDYNVPIWVLEYGGECWNGGAGNQSIMTTITAWFDATSWIGRYAWFANRLSGSEPNAVGWQSCSLINPNTGALTSLGQLYRAY